MEAMRLTEFLLARIAEDETMFSAAGPHWSEISAYMLPGFNQHRALTECEAKRRIIALHVEFHVSTSVGASMTKNRQQLDWDYSGCGTCLPPDDWERGTVDYWPCPTLLAIAAPYASHPDFEPAWSVEENQQ